MLTALIRLVLMGLLGAGAVAAEDARASLERARALHAQGMGVLAAHQQLEDSLLFEDNDRLVVFLSIPHGARMILDELALFLNGQEVARYPYTGAELLKFQSRGEQIFYATRIPPGRHSLKLEARVVQGRLKPMAQPYIFQKGRGGKFVELQLVGAPEREIQATDW